MQNNGFNHLFIITHTDLDGVGSAAAALASSRRSPGEATIVYAEPYNIHEALSQLEEHVSPGDLLVIADLGPNRESYPRAIEIIRRLTGRSARVEWYDHHIWEESEKNMLKKAGAAVHIDTTTCATGVVARYMPGERGLEPPEWLGELVAAVCAADLWRWDHPLAPKLFRVAEYRYEEGREAWRNRLVEKFSRGTLWDEELEKALQSYISLELANFNRILSTAYVTPPPCIVAATYKSRGPPSNSFIGASLLSRHRADIAVIVRDNGAISLRSRTVNVREVARQFGGGGHPRAAGAKVRLGLLARLETAILGKKRLARKAARMVRRIAIREGLC